MAIGREFFKRWFCVPVVSGSKTRFYGDGMTIHRSTHVDVETFNGKVVSVWFRCQNLPFLQTEVGEIRAREMEYMYQRESKVELHGVEVWDGR